MSNFSKKATQGSKDSAYKENRESSVQKKEFIRSKQNNKMFQGIQVKNIKDIVTEDCINVIDADSIPFKCASACEEDYTIVKCLLDESEITDEKILKNCVFEVEEEYKNKTAFKGAARGSNISAGSVLGDKNLKREAFGLIPYTMEDFELIPKKRLKYEEGVTIDGIEFKDSASVCKYYIDEWINAIRIQTQIPNVLVVLGQGETHRHDLLLPHQYKSDRTGERPLLLKEMRSYIQEAYPSEMAQQREEGVSRGLEADEKCDEYGFKGYLHYRRTGKFSYIKSAIDKDNWNSCGISFNYTKAFHFEYPQPWLIEHRDIYVGDLELVKGKIKGTGLRHAVYQILLEDSADEYGSRKFLPDNVKEGIKYGPAAFYKDFITLETPKEVLEKMVGKFAEWFPKGLQYTAWDGTEINEDTLSWLNKCFLCMYMRLKWEDPTQVTNWLDQYKIDYSFLVNNHIEKKLEVAPEDSIRNTFEGAMNVLDSLQSILGNTKGKKDDLIERMADVDKQLGYLQESLKSGLFLGGEVLPTEAGRTLQQVIDVYNKENGYESEPDADYESFVEGLSEGIVSEETSSEHRWYDVRDIVHKVTIDGKERYFQTFDYHTTGDNSARDMGLDLPTIDDVSEVFPSKEVVTVYK